MEVEIREEDRGHEIRIETEEEIALVVYTPEGERIYLPGAGESSSSYYEENPTRLQSFEGGYRVMHTEGIQDFEVLS